MRKLLVIDTSYTDRMVRERSLTRWILARELDGYFDSIWNIHPFGDIADPGEARRERQLVVTKFSETTSNATFITGAIKRNGRVSPIRFLMSQFFLFCQLKKLVKEENVTFVHALDPGYSGLLAWLTASATGRPLVLWARSHNDHLRSRLGRPVSQRLFPWRWVESLVERWTFTRANVVFAYCDYNAAYARDCGVAEERIVLLGQERDLEIQHLGGVVDEDIGTADTRSFQLETSWSHCTLLVSRCESLKHPQDAIDAVLLLVEEGVDAGLVIAGGGSQLEALKKYVESRGHSDRVLFLGFVDSWTIRRLLDEVDVVVSPLTGSALLEAGRAGCSVVAYDVDWHSELIRNRDTGLLVPFRDVSALAEGLGEFFNDAPLAQTLGENLKVHCLSRPTRTSLLERERAAHTSIVTEKDHL